MNCMWVVCFNVTLIISKFLIKDWQYYWIKLSNVSMYWFSLDIILIANYFNRSNMNECKISTDPRNWLTLPYVRMRIYTQSWSCENTWVTRRDIDGKWLDMVKLETVVYERVFCTYFMDGIFFLSKQYFII